MAKNRNRALEGRRDRQSVQEVTEWVLHSCESNHAECGGVYISTNPITPSAEEFISSVPNIGSKKSKSNRHLILYKKLNRNCIEEKPQLGLASIT